MPCADWLLCNSSDRFAAEEIASGNLYDSSQHRMACGNADILRCALRVPKKKVTSVA